MKRLLVAALILLTQAACSARAEEQETPGDVYIAAYYATAQMNLRNGDLPSVADALEPAVEPGVFARLSPPKQYEIAQLYARGASAGGQWKKAHRGYQLATQSPKATRADWSGRLEAAIYAVDGADALATFAHEVDQGRPVLRGLDEGGLSELDSLISQSPNPTEARIALGRQMEREHFQFEAPYEDASVVWLHYVQALLERGDLAAASSAATHITSPMVMMAMQADRRFDALIAQDPGRFDPKAAAERNLAAARRAAADRPKVIGYRVAEARALSILNRPNEALALLDGLVRDPQLRNSIDCSCVHDWRESVLMSVGRGEETLAARERQAHRPGVQNYSVLYLVKAQLRLDHPQAVRQTLKEMPPTGLGQRGQMDLALTAVCAVPGQGEEVGRQLAFLREHQAWKPEAYIDALLCSERMPAAAAALVQQLQDPNLRLAALTHLQVYGQDPVTTAHVRTLTARWAQLRAMPAIKAEVEKVGRIRTYDLMQWEEVA